MSIYPDISKLTDKTDDRDDERLVGPKLVEIESEEEAFQQIANFCYASSFLGPYVTDFFHEKREVMRGILQRDLELLMKGLWKQSGHLYSDYRKRTGVQFKVCRIKRILNIEVFTHYTLRRSEELKRFLQDGVMPVLPLMRNIPTVIESLPAPIIKREIGECFLFSGHSKKVIKSIAESGAKPHLGSYDPMKGYGALGKGAYFTDRFDKAMTYAPCSVCEATSSPCVIFGGDDRNHYRRLVLNQVILGRPLLTKDGSSFRHSTHDQLIKKPIPNINQPVTTMTTTTTSEKPISGDSLIGVETYKSGGSMLTALWWRNNFDSNEYLVRNGDQVYPAYVIYYKYTRPLERSSKL